MVLLFPRSGKGQHRILLYHNRLLFQKAWFVSHFQTHKTCSLSCVKHICSHTGCKYPDLFCRSHWFPVRIFWEEVCLLTFQSILTLDYQFQVNSDSKVNEINVLCQNQVLKTNWQLLSSSLLIHKRAHLKNKQTQPKGYWRNQVLIWSGARSLLITHKMKRQSLFCGSTKGGGGRERDRSIDSTANKKKWGKNKTKGSLHFNAS